MSRAEHVADAPAWSVRADRVLAAPGRDPVVHDAHVTVAGDRVAPADADGAEPAARLDAGPGSLLLPALANGHDHGRFFPPLVFGAVDQPLETWLAALALQPDLDQHLTATAYLARLARRGVASTMHLHRARPVDVLVEEAAGICTAAEEVGLRLAFAVPLQDRNHVAYSCGTAGPSGALADAGAPWRPTSIPSVATLMDTVAAIAAAHASPTVTVQYGPLGPQWASDELLTAVAEGSQRSGRRVHLHLLETRRQREWADAAHPEGVVVHLDRLGLLSPRTSVAHGVWLRPAEADVLAERGVTVVLNTSSNLRVRAGSAPVGDLLSAGVPLAMGLDGSTLDGDDDAFRELRLLGLMHAGSDLEPVLTPTALFRVAIDGGASAVHGGPGPWGLAPGAPADLVVLDGDGLAGDVLPAYRDDLALLLARGSSALVRHAWVAGRRVVTDGAAVRVDEPAAVEELRARLAALPSPLPGATALPGVQDALRRHYRAGAHRSGGRDAELAGSQREGNAEETGRA